MAQRIGQGLSSGFIPVPAMLAASQGVGLPGGHRAALQKRAGYCDRFEHLVTGAE